MTSDPRHPTVLVVDDDSDTRELYNIMLGAVGYAVVTADRVSAVTPALRRQPPHVIITDWLLPDGDGLAVASEVRSVSRDVPLVCVTGVSMPPERAAELKQEGFVSILLKPALPDEVLRAVHGASEVATARRLRSAALRLGRYAARAAREAQQDPRSSKFDTGALVCRAAKKSGEHITLAIIDDAAHYVAAGGGSRELTGYEPEELLLLSVDDLMPQAAVRPASGEAGADDPREGRSLLRRRDGVPVEAQYCFIPNAAPGLHVSALAAAIEVPASL